MVKTRWKLVFWSYDVDEERPFVSYYENLEDAEEEYSQRLAWSYGDDLPKPTLTKVEVNP